MSSNLYLNQFAAQAPEQPGVYQFFDDKEKILYIGKAKNLKNRLLQYARGSDDKKTNALCQKIHQCTLTICSSEEQALLLEQKLIRQHKPPYNILLKDDKSYPYIIMTAHHFPEIKTFRGTLCEKMMKSAFGPYPSAGLAQQTLELLVEIFQLRTCSDHTFKTRKRPCLQYQIGRCSAPCVNYINEKDYMDQIQKAEKFLHSNEHEVIDYLIEKMKIFSEQELFEKAALIRTHIEKLRSLQRQSSEVRLKFKRYDLLSLQWPYAHHLRVSDQDLISSKFYVIKTQGSFDKKESIEGFLNYIYSPLDKKWLPDLLYVDEEYLTDPLNILGENIPLKLAKDDLTKKFYQMAQESLWQNIQQHHDKNSFFKKRFQELEKQLGLKEINSIDCLDISHIQGEHTLGAFVRLSKEGFLKKYYRRYNIKYEGTLKNDDTFCIYQCTKRHFEKVSQGFTPADVVLIDGGVGQLKAAGLALEELGIKIPLYSMAKGEGRKFGLEKIYQYEESTPKAYSQVEINPLSPAFALLGQVRDEAHRFAIKAVRKKVSQKMIQSPLDEISGIGAQKKSLLLQSFGGWQGLKKADLLQLKQVPGIGPKLAEKIAEFLKKYQT